MRHVPVLIDEVLNALRLKTGMRVIDATLGDAGHAEKILSQIGKSGKLLGIDADPEAILRAKKFLEGKNNVVFVRSNFSELKNIVVKEKFSPVDAILIDLGWSTPQFENRGRGFSFTKNEPLDMRYNPSNGDQTAESIINTSSKEQLEMIFREYGEEKLSKKIAEKIVEKREDEKIESTEQLVSIILDVYRKKLRSKKEVPWVGGLHPATKVFQALRIAVNDELDVLKDALSQAMDVLAPGGRLVVISFHSLEDRIVKHAFKAQKNKKIKIITKKPITCSKEEYKNNPPSRSAKMRVVEKI